MISNYIQYNKNEKLTHLLDIENLKLADLNSILKRAQKFIQDFNSPGISFPNKRLVNLFFEPSTRTKCSFEIAAQNLNMHVVNLDLNNSSLHKGETIIDTLNTLEAMHSDIFVIRHSENNLPHKIATKLKHSSHILNAGDGNNAHPTQGLLDMLTILQHKKSFNNLKVAIIGDIRHSRVAHSDIYALLKLNVKEISLIAPKVLLPSKIVDSRINLYSNLQQGLQDVDVIMCLRMQKERHSDANIPSFEAFHKNWGLNSNTISHAKEDAIIMHPGPVNRNVEISSELTDISQNVMLQQVTNGVAVRMAVIEMLLTI